MDSELYQKLMTMLYDPLTGKFVFLLVAIGGILLLVKGLQKTAGSYVKDSAIRYRVRKLVELAGFLLFVFVITLIFNDRLGSLTVAFGVAGAGIAFALQEVIASVAGWFAITFNNFFKPGDRVLLGGICGDVIDVGLLRTTLMECGGWIQADLYNGRVVRVANSYIFKEPVYNYSTDFPFLWDEITVPIQYGSDLKRTRHILETVAHDVLGTYTQLAQDKWKEFVKKYLIDSAQIEPTVTLVVDENWITFTLRYITDFKLRRATKSRLFTLILEEIEHTNGAVKIGCNSIMVIKKSAGLLTE